MLFSCYNPIRRLFLLYKHIFIFHRYKHIFIFHPYKHIFPHNNGVVIIKTYFFISIHRLLLLTTLLNLLQGMNVPGTIMIAELFPTENRTHVLLLGGVMWVFGVILMAPVAYVFRNFNWRVLHAIFNLFFICSFIEIW